MLRILAFNNYGVQLGLNAAHAGLVVVGGREPLLLEPSRLCPKPPSLSPPAQVPKAAQHLGNSRSAQRSTAQVGCTIEQQAVAALLAMIPVTTPKKVRTRCEAVNVCGSVTRASLFPTAR